MKYKIGETLKKCRLDANKSIKEISDLLISKGFKASEKLYIVGKPEIASHLLMRC